MTEHFDDPTVDFMIRLKKIDRSGLKVRDVIVLWFIAREPGMMGRELSDKLGFQYRSHIQDGLQRLMTRKFIEDRRPVDGNLQQTPNDFHILPAGEEFLAEIVPA